MIQQCRPRWSPDQTCISCDTSPSKTQTAMSNAVQFCCCSKKVLLLKKEVSVIKMTNSSKISQGVNPITNK